MTLKQRITSVPLALLLCLFAVPALMAQPAVEACDDADRPVIPAIAPSTYVLDVPDSVSVGELNVFLNLTQAAGLFIYDVALTSPGGTTIDLSPGFESENGHIHCTFSDAGARPDSTGPGLSPYNCGGCLLRLSSVPFRHFVGEDTAGEWELSMGSFQLGHLNRWCLLAYEIATVKQIACRPSDSGTGMAELSWKNGADYDTVVVYWLGELVGEIVDEFAAGETYAYALPAALPTPGVASLRVVGFVDGVESAPADCVVSLPGEPALCIGDSPDAYFGGNQTFFGLVEFTDPMTILDMTVDVELTLNDLSSLWLTVQSYTGTSVELFGGLGLGDDALLATYWTLGTHDYPEVEHDVVRPRGPGSLMDFSGESTVSTDGNGAFLFQATGFDSGRIKHYTICAHDVTPPLPPTDVSCVTGTGIGIVDTTWINGADYEEIRIYVNDKLAVVESGGFDAGSTGLFTTVIEKLPFEAMVCVQGVLANGATGPVSCCSFTAALPPVESVECSADSGTSTLAVQWTIPATLTAYDSINIFAGGDLVSVIPGDATSYEMDLGARTGATIAIQGALSDPATISLMRTCGAMLPLPPADIEECTTLVGAPAEGTIISTLEVTETFSIDRIEVAMALATPGFGFTRVFLTPPSGGSRTLHPFAGAAPEDGVLVVWADEGTAQIDLPLEDWDDGYVIRPQGPFQILEGTSAKGTWKLTVSDDRCPFALQWWCIRIYGCPILRPASFACSSPTESHVDLNWTNGSIYDEIRIYQDDALLDTISGTDTLYSATNIEGGHHRFQVAGYTAAADCEARSIVRSVAVGFTTVCTSFDESVFSGVLGVTVNEPAVIDHVNVPMDLSTSPQAQWRITLTSPSGTDVDLHGGQGFGRLDLIWSEEPGARANGDDFTCNQCLMRPSPGTLESFAGEPAEGEWSFRYVGYAHEGRVEEVCVEILGACELIPPAKLVCEGVGDDIVLEWDNLDTYDSIRIERDGALLATELPGTATQYTDEGPVSGVYRYRIVAWNDEVACTATSRSCEAARGVTHACNETDAPLTGPSTYSLAGVLTPISITGATDATDVRVLVDIEHPRISDLTIEVVNPSGVSVTLYSGESPTDGDLRDVHCWFADYGLPLPAASYRCGDCAIRPVGPGRLRDLVAGDINGHWTLRLRGADPTHGATLDSWCIDLVAECATPAPVITSCATENHDDRPPVALAWRGTEDANAVRVLRNRVVIAELEGTETSYVDHTIDVPGRHEYQIAATSADLGCTTLSAPSIAVIGALSDCSTLSVPGNNLPKIDVIDLDPATIDSDPDFEASIAQVHVPLHLVAPVFHTTVVVDVFSPSGTGVVLMHSSGVRDETLVTFTDEADRVLSQVDRDCECLVRPAGPGLLADMIGESPWGEWLVAVRASRDLAVEWCVDVYPAEMPPPFTDDRGPRFRRGDVDGNGAVVPIIDVLRMLDWGFRDGAAPPCLAAADVNGDGVVVPIVEALSLLAWGFTGGAAPPAPGPTTCGRDPDLPATGGLIDTDPSDACATFTGHADGCTP